MLFWDEDHGPISLDRKLLIARRSGLWKHFKEHRQVRAAVRQL